jgi:hypothetical protein
VGKGIPSNQQAHAIMACIAAITTVRNDPVFLDKWIQHYGAALGRKHLFVVLDGHDQELPPRAGDINVLRLPFKPLPRVAAMRRRAQVMSKIAAGLYHYFDMCIATDVDEYLVVDPHTGLDLHGYLARFPRRRWPAISGLGLDVGQHLDEEAPLDLQQPFLQQRRYAHVSSRYTKPVVTTRPVTWGSGMHRVKRHNYHIDPNLYIFHCGMIDMARSGDKTTDSDRLNTGWGGHLNKRSRLFDIITTATPVDGDAYFPKARFQQTWLRKIYALNKPAMIPGDPVVRIPERFRSLL